MREAPRGRAAVNLARILIVLSAINLAAWVVALIGLLAVRGGPCRPLGLPFMQILAAWMSIHTIGSVDALGWNEPPLRSRRFWRLIIRPVAARPANAFSGSRPLTRFLLLATPFVAMWVVGLYEMRVGECAPFDFWDVFFVTAHGFSWATPLFCLAVLALGKARGELP